MNFFKSWPKALRDRTFRRHLILAVVGLGAVLFFYPRFLFWVEARPGVVLVDPLSDFFPKADCSILLFSVIYGSIVIGLYGILPYPAVLVRGLRAYGWMIALRIAIMALLPLDPPAGTLPLQDPFVQLFGGNSSPLTKDLFFSGHTATLFVLAYHQRKTVLKWLLWLAFPVLIPLLMMQKTHYSADIFAAPFFAYCACQLARWPE